MKITTLLVQFAFIQHQAKHKETNQKAYLLSLGRPNLFEDQKPPQNPI
jgi:hypothetical protein